MSDQRQIAELKTISRLFHQVAFKNEATRMNLKTLQLSYQYIRLFINEAIARSNEQRLEEAGKLNHIDGIDNIEEVRNKESEDVEEEVPDVTIIEDDLPSITQYDANSGQDLMASLDTRHLSKVMGELILDF